MSGQRTALVIGASGGAGGEVAQALLAHGWRVRGCCGADSVSTFPASGP